MTVAEYIELLKYLPQDACVVERCCTDCDTTVPVEPWEVCVNSDNELVIG